jgi:hypothetical protein
MRARRIWEDHSAVGPSVGQGIPADVEEEGFAEAIVSGEKVEALAELGG